MSRPPSVASSTPSSAPGTPRATTSGSGTTPIHTIVQNLPNLFQMYEKGTLSDTQITQLRQLMNTHIRQITANALQQNRPNPLFSLPDAINPSLPWKNQAALVTKEAFTENIKTITRNLLDTAQRAANTGAARPGVVGQGAGTAVSAAASPAAVRPTGTSPAPSQAGAEGPGIQPTLTAPQPAPAPAPAGPSGVPASTLGVEGAVPPRPRPAPAIFSHHDLSQLAKLSPEARNAWLAKDPSRQQQFQASLAYWRSQPKSNFTSQNRPPSQAAASGPGRPSLQTGPGGLNATTPNATATPAFATALPDARGFALRPPPANGPGPGINGLPSAQARPPPVPQEPESVRRKRQLHKMLGEVAPGMALEAGMDTVLSEVMDKMLEQAMEGAVRMAKHRGGDKVELKDMARYIDHAWEMTVPGFDAAPAHHVHVAPDKEKKKGKQIAPRAATRLTRKEDE